MRAKLRMTWKATCGSFEQACTQRSPPVRVGSSASPGSAGRSASAAGRLAARPNRSSNKRRAEADGDRQLRRRRARAPRRCRPAATAGRSRSGRSAGPPSSGRPRPPTTPSIALQLRRRSVLVTSNAAKASRSWAGVAMPAWCGAVERRPWSSAAASTPWRRSSRRPRDAEPGTAGRRPRRPRPARRRGNRGGCGAVRSSEFARRRGRVGHSTSPTTLPATCRQRLG